MIPINGELEARLRALIVEEMLHGQDEAELTSTTELVQAGIVNSINALRLVDLVEEEYQIELMPADIRQFTTIANIVRIVGEKVGQPV